MQLTIEPYSSTDKNNLINLIGELQAHEHQFDSLKSVNLASASAYLTELIDNTTKNGGEILVARQNNSCLGFISWYIESELEFDSPYAYISDIVVSSKMRGQGIGQQLLDTALDHITKTKVKRVHIGVMVGNLDTKKFYEKNGFIDYSLEMVKELK